jgi:hypothetical protein
MRSRATSLEGLVEGILVSGTLGTMALQPVACGFNSPSRWTCTMFVPAPDEDTDDYPLDPEGLTNPTRWSYAIGSNCPFRRSTAQTARACAPVCGGDRNLGMPGDHPSTGSALGGARAAPPTDDQN